MLAGEYEPLKFKAEGSFLSEKLDGVRALWLPFTRGMNFKDVPWANTARDDRNYVCSGLWTRRGKTILAPSWWLDALPKDCPLDGELFAGRGNFQQVTSTVRKLDPVTDEWEKITYKVFDIPNYTAFFQPGQIREGVPPYELWFKRDWLDLWPDVTRSPHFGYRRFNESYTYLLTKINWGDGRIAEPLKQTVLPPTRQAAEYVLDQALTEVTEQNGEGLMMRRGHSLWVPKRSEDLVKVKKLYDAEATISGYVFGVGKYQGMVGAFRVKWDTAANATPIEFDLSGFTDAERQVRYQHQPEATANPGKFTELNVSEQFPIGSTVTFAYNDLTNDGVPRFARYLRRAMIL